MTQRLGAAGLVAVLLLGLVAAAPVLAVASPSSPDIRPAVATDTGVAPQTAPDPIPQTTPEGFDSTVFQVTTYENGSAQWTLRYLRLLENDSQVATFEDYAAGFERTEPQFVRDFRTRAERLTSFGTEATGRNMTATDFRRAASVRTQIGGAQATGVVELSFRWNGFAAVGDGRVVVADVFEGGMYIGADQRLVLGHGPGLTFEAVDPATDSRSGETLAGSETVTWVGERRFSDARPRVTYTQAGAGSDTGTPAGTTTTTADNQTPGVDDPGPGNGTGEEPPDEGGLSLVSSLAVGLVVLLGLGGLAWYADMLPTDTGGGPDSTGGPSAGADGPPAAGAGSTQSQQTAATPAVSEEELLSDEDRVRRLLEGNGGRMKQVDIVDETEWSKSKVSMLLSEMEEDGEISKLRVGRENIISLSGHEPDAAGSPFDEE
ncbi:MAG: hypothetical protein ACI9HI_001676 [Salinirussus sp.]|jgi:hypothetical protein